MAVQDETGWREAVLGAYSGVLDRVPDEKEIKYWMGVARSGVVGADLQNAFNNAAQAELAGRGNTVQDATNALAQNSTAGQQNQASNVVNTGATGALSAANTAADVGDINLGGDTDSAAGALANASLPAAQQQQAPLATQKPVGMKPFLMPMTASLEERPDRMRLSTGRVSLVVGLRVMTY
jgi:hypothetical protein